MAATGSASRVIDFQPDEEQQLIVETLQTFAAKEIRARARECDESGKLPDEVLHAAHELGLVANAVDEQQNNAAGRSAVTAALVVEELAWGDLSIALAILSPSLLALPIADHGTLAQRERWLPTLTAEHFVPGSLAVVEPEYASDPFAPATRARADGDGWTLDGRKCLVPWIDGGDTVLVTATTDEGPRAFLVPRDAAGLSATPEQNLGLAGLPTAELALAGVRVPPDAALESDGGASVRRILTRGRVGLAAAAVGVARAAFEIARDYAKERHAFGGPIATKQAIAFRLADMAIEIDGARLLAWEAAWTLDAGRDAEREASLALQQARRVALEVADGAVQVLGGYGYIRDYLPEMHLRNARGFACFEALTLV
jgi:alkylation response protein AidB-like acyl-CoA dehydrogenase